MLTVLYLAAGVLVGIPAARWLNDVRGPDDHGQVLPPMAPAGIALCFLTVVLIWPLIAAYFLLEGLGLLLTWGQR